MIRMTHGSTRIGVEIYTSKSGAFQADEATERRLVSLGVAVWVLPDLDEGTPPSDAETSTKVRENRRTGNTMPDSGNSTEATGGGSIRDDLMNMKREDMERLAAELGIDEQTIRACKNKNELADEIVAAEGEGEEMPSQLSAEDVVD